MKLALNGALTIGTLDGANVEIHRAQPGRQHSLIRLGTGEIALAEDSWRPAGSGESVP